jgi:hypothetical protein
MPDLVERLGSIRNLGKEGSSLQSSNSDDKQRKQRGKARPSLSPSETEVRSIHIRLPQQQVKKLDLLRLSAKSSRTSIIEKAIEQYLSSEQVRTELDVIKKSM